MRGIYIIRNLVRDPNEPFGFVLWDWMRPQKEERRDTLICEEVCVSEKSAVERYAELWARLDEQNEWEIYSENDYGSNETRILMAPLWESMSWDQQRLALALGKQLVAKRRDNAATHSVQTPAA